MTEGHPAGPLRVEVPSEACRVRVGAFEGPLDLLLHLVRVNEVDVTDIPIVEIARQYQEYLDLMRELNLEVAGEYLVMAATLLHIKSRMLLPPDPAPPEEGAAEDPRAELVEQLLDYQRFKQAAEGLSALESVRSLVWTRDGRIPADFAGEEVLAADLFDLLRAFRVLLERLGEEARLRIRRDQISIAERIEWLTGLLQERGAVSFFELFAELPGRMERIAAFLALLEMVRLRLLLAFQRSPAGDIHLALKPEALAASREDGEP